MYWDFGIQPFDDINVAMRTWIASGKNSPAIWMGEHPVVISKGTRSHSIHVPYWPQSCADRGGEMTVHAPGQLVCYPLWVLGRSGMSLTKYRWILEQAVINTLSTITDSSIVLMRRESQPGVFTPNGKIASIGLRLSYSGWTSHGLSMNLCCPLKPFHDIVCCGDLTTRATTLYAHKGIFAPIVHVKKILYGELISLINQEVEHVHHYSST